VKYLEWTCWKWMRAFLAWLYGFLWPPEKTRRATNPTRAEREFLAGFPPVPMEGYIVYPRRFGKNGKARYGWVRRTATPKRRWRKAWESPPPPNQGDYL